MSADNFVGVRENKAGTYGIFEYGSMSVYDGDCMYLADATPDHVCQTRGEALVLAHDIVKEMDICEYGVVEMSELRTEPCGRCFVCVHERNIVSDDLETCCVCGKKISQSEWACFTNNKVYHIRCAPAR